MIPGPTGLLGVEEAAKQLGVSLHTLRTWLRQGRLPFVRLGRRVLLEPRALTHFIRRNRVIAGGPNEPEAA